MQHSKKLERCKRSFGEFWEEQKEFAWSWLWCETHKDQPSSPNKIIFITGAGVWRKERGTAHPNPLSDMTLSISLPCFCTPLTTSHFSKTVVAPNEVLSAKLILELILPLPQTHFCATSCDENKRSYFFPRVAKFNFVSIGFELGSNKSSPQGHLLLHCYSGGPGKCIWTCGMLLIGYGSSNCHVTWMGKWAQLRQYQRKCKFTVKWKAANSQEAFAQTFTDNPLRQLMIFYIILWGSRLLQAAKAYQITILPKNGK